MRCVLSFLIVLFSTSMASATDLSTDVDCPLPSVAKILAGEDRNVTKGSELEARLLADAADGRLDELSPIEAALIAGGVETTESLRRYCRKTTALGKWVCRSIDAAMSPRDRAEAVFDFLHRRVLRGGYVLKGTDLRRTLDRGQFNCVTATVLFNYLAGRAGLECRGLQMPGHAMSRVMLPDGSLDVETTCPQWFIIKDDPRRRAVAVSAAIGAASGDRSQAEEVAPIQLAAMIYYNQGVDLLAENRFAEAVAANAKALRLDPANRAARGNLLASINNWSIELGNSGEYAAAARLLRAGMSIDANFTAFSSNFVHVHRQWTEQLCRRGNFAEAMNVLSSAETAMPNVERLDSVRRQVDRCRSQAAAALHSERQPHFPCSICTPAVN